MKFNYYCLKDFISSNQIVCKCLKNTRNSLNCFRCELPSFGDFGRRDVYLLSYIMEVDGTHACGAQSTKTIHLKYSTAMCLSRNHDPFTQDNP